MYNNHDTDSIKNSKDPEKSSSDDENDNVVHCIVLFSKVPLY